MIVQFNLPATLLVAVDSHERTLAGAQVTYNDVDYRIVDCESLEFNGFGELKNWSAVSEEDATLLLTKAPVEPPQEEQGVDLFKQVCDAIGVNYLDYYLDDICHEYVLFRHIKEDRWFNIDFGNGVVQVGHGSTSAPPRKLNITLE
jgi:hypothetical protein